MFNMFTVFLFLLSGFIFSVYFYYYLNLPAFLSIIIKAYSMGIFNCHTTNILIR